MTDSHPIPYKNFSSASYPHDLEKQVEGLEFPEADIKTLERSFFKSREQILFSLKEANGDVNEAKFFCVSKKYILKEELPEEGALSIIGIQSMDESKIFSETGIPVFISDQAAEHYQVESLEQMIGKKVRIFRRNRTAFGYIEYPNRMYLQEGILMELKDTYSLSQATATVFCDGELSEPIKIERICIDWD